MRRALYFLAAVLVGAASTASAQARAVTMARLVTQAKGPPQLAVHVSNLLDDPEWLEPWGNAYFVQLHWKVQLWQERTFINASLPPLEWDVCVQQVPGLDLFNYGERFTGRPTRKTFSTLDSLKAWLTSDVAPPAQALSPGKWYYLIDVHVSTSAEDPCDPRTASGGGLKGLIQGTGPTRDLPQKKLPFTVPGP